MSPLKKTLLIAAFVLVVTLVGFGIYFIFKDFRAGGELPPRTTAPTAGGPGALPTAGERPAAEPPAVTPGALPTGQPVGGEELTLPSGPSYYSPEPVTKVSEDYATFSSTGADGGLRYHNASDGKFYQVAADGSIRSLSDEVFYNVQKVTWAKSADKAVLEYPDGAKIIYNFETKKQFTIPKHWSDFSFSPEGNELAAKSIGLSPDNRWLVVTKDDGTGTRLIEPMGNNADRVTVDWSPSKQTVAFSRTGQPQGADRQEVLFIGLNGENFKSAIVEGLNFQPQWSPTGQKLLYSVDSARSDFKPELWVTDAFGDNIGGNRRSLKLNTWAKKCAFGDENTLFCAVPQELPQGAGMAPDIANSIPDDLYRVDLKTGLKTNIPLPNDHTVNGISYDQTKNKLFFTDKNQNGIFQVNL